MSQLKKVFEQGTIKNVRIKNRISMAPMERGYANMDGSVSQKYIDYITERAKNGVGMIAVEATYVDPVGRGRVYQLGIFDDKLIPSHKKLTDEVHRYGAKITVELHHAGRQATANITGFQPVAPSPVPCAVSGGDMPRELTINEISGIIDKYAEAAVRAKKAGYDMITIHGAHGYIINAFASPFSNKRNDEYGGTPEKRMRFPLEVYRAVRRAVGNDFPVGYRMSADEFVEGGLTLDDTKVIAQQLEDAGIDFLDVSAGIYESTPVIAGITGTPLGYLVHLAAGIKEVVKIPVITTGRINDMSFAEKILEDNQADFVHMVRAFHADPEILVKSQKSQIDEVNMCMACLRCVDVWSAGNPSICTVNPAAGREREFELKPTKTKKKVMVIGGGIAGMEAARIARLRGHEVTLFEKESELGGQIRWASKPRLNEEFYQTARYRIQQVKKTGVKVELDKEVTLADIKHFKPDVVIVATGALPYIPAIPGVNNGIVGTSFDVLSGKKKPGNKNIVIGGKREGLTVAEFLADNGGKTIIVEPGAVLGTDLGGTAQWVIGDRVKENNALEVRLKTTVEKISENSVILRHEGATEEVTGIDLVVLAWNKSSVNQLAFDVMIDGCCAEVYHIGDAVFPRNASDAIFEGALIGRRI